MKPSVPKSKELNVCGWQAVSTLFARHPGEVQRLFFDAATGKRAGEYCSLLATQKKVYRQVDPAELDKIAGSKLHGGIIDYARQLKAEGLPSKYKGQNFVFDERLAERIVIGFERAGVVVAHGDQAVTGQDEGDGGG